MVNIVLSVLCGHARALGNAYLMNFAVAKLEGLLTKMQIDKYCTELQSSLKWACPLHKALATPTQGTVWTNGKAANLDCNVRCLPHCAAEPQVQCSMVESESTQVVYHTDPCQIQIKHIEWIK